MHHRVHPIEQFRGKLSNVAEDLPVEEGLGQKARPGQAMTKIGGIKSD